MRYFSVWQLQFTAAQRNKFSRPVAHLVLATIRSSDASALRNAKKKKLVTVFMRIDEY